MKSFEEIIKEHPLINNTTLKKTLESNDLLEMMQNTHMQLASSLNKPRKKLNIRSLILNILKVSSNKIMSISCNKQKSKIEFILISLSEIILREYIIKNVNQQQMIIPQIEEAIKITCNKCNYNLVPYEKLLKYKLQSLSISFDKKKDKKRIKTDSTEKCRSIYWLEKGKLFELVYILKKKNYIKSKKDLFAFFQSPKPGIIVQCNAKKKYHIAYLLYRLFNENYVCITGNKGYFCCAEMMFYDYEGNPFKRNSLKKISSKIFKNKEKYLHVRKEIDAIISKI